MTFLNRYKAVFRRSLPWLFLVMGIFGSGSGQAEQSIHALRGAYLFYFSHFIEWPAGTVFEGNNFELCALTDNTADRYQLYTINGKSVGDARLRISILESDQLDQKFDMQSCHMLFVAASYSKWLSQNVKNLSTKTLLVTEGDIKYKGLVHLYVENHKLKFVINQKKLNARDFKASSKLLRLSRRNGRDA